MNKTPNVLFWVKMGNGGNSALVTLSRTNAFYPGDVVTGVLHLDIPTPIDSCGIFLKLTGKEYVHWSEQHSSGSGKRRRTHTVHYYGGSSLFKLTLPIKDSPCSSLSGQFEYPFEFQLPSDIPGSFEYRSGAVTGYILYKLKGVLARPGWFKSDIKHRVYINVLSKPNLAVQRRLTF